MESAASLPVVKSLVTRTYDGRINISKGERGYVEYPVRLFLSWRR
jgi:hypothetical protein